MNYNGEERKVNCTICGCEVKETFLFDSTSISELYYATCQGCGFELNIEQGDDWSKVSPSYNSYDFNDVSTSLRKEIIDLISNKLNKVYSDSYIEYHKMVNAVTKKYDLIRYNKFEKSVSILEG